MNLAKLKAVLAMLVTMAESHTEDITSGISEGLYAADDNLDLQDKILAIESASLFLAELSADPVAVITQLQATDDGEESTEHLDFFEGYIELDGNNVSFQTRHGATRAEKDAAFFAALAQTADINYLCIGSDVVPKSKEVSHALTEVHQCAMKTLQSMQDFDTADRRFIIFANWLDLLLSRESLMLNDIEAYDASRLPGNVQWFDEKGELWEFLPSTALLSLLVLAKKSDLNCSDAAVAENFTLLYGNKLDSILAPRN